MRNDPIAKYSKEQSIIRTSWRFALVRLTRILIGVAGVVVIAGYVQCLHLRYSLWPAYYVPGLWFAIATLCVAILAYLFSRCLFGRLASLIVGVLCAGIRGCLFLWPKGGNMPQFTVLGMLIACSLFVAIGWLDRDKESFLKRICLCWSKRKKESSMDLEEGDEG